MEVRMGPSLPPGGRSFLAVRGAVWQARLDARASPIGAVGAPAERPRRPDLRPRASARSGRPRGARARSLGDRDRGDRDLARPPRLLVAPLEPLARPRRAEPEARARSCGAVADARA